MLPVNTMRDQNAKVAGTLNRDAIAALIVGNPPLVENFVDLEAQLQPNGFDITLQSIAGFSSGVEGGSIGISDADRRLAGSREHGFDGDGWGDLAAGAYLITFNEVVNLPLGLMALGRPRSSLLRSGVSLHTAVWDAGYSGRSQALLVVHNESGFRLQRNARVAQLVFFTLTERDAQGYSGRYQFENV